MSVKFFGQYLIDQGEVDASHVREALALMDQENASFGEIAVREGLMQSAAVARVHAGQRTRDASFGDLAVEMGLLAPADLVKVLKRQREERVLMGEALVQLGHLGADRLGTALDAYKADQAQYEVSDVTLPDGLASHHVTRWVIELFPRFLMRVARMPGKVGDVRSFDGAPEFAEVRVSVPMLGGRGLEVALVSDEAFAEALAMEAAGLDRSDLDAELVADGVGEFLNVLCGNAASAMTREGHRVELGPPDYEAELCDGWIVELAVGTGRAALVLSTF
jgi:hypothetical protein